MLGRFEPADRRATVVGAGVAGLLAAHALDRRGFEVTLLEARPRAGGLISTVRTGFGISESAAHSFLATPAVEGLCAELGVPLLEVNARARARFVVRDGRLRRFPLTPLEAAGALWRASVRRAELPAPTMAELAARHLGPAARDYLVSPMLAGIHAAPPDEIDAEAAFPRFVPRPGRTLIGQLLRRPPATAAAATAPRKRGRHIMKAPRDGMGALVSMLETTLSVRLGSRFRRGEPVDALPTSPNVVLCVPALEAARLLRNVEGRAAEALGSVAYSPLISITVFVERRKLAAAREGVGFLVPARENRRILGVLFNSSAFGGRVADPERFASYTAMVGGSIRPELAGLSDDELRRLVREELAWSLGLEGEPAAVVIHRHTRALPRYGPELARVWTACAQSWCARPGRVLFGNYTGQLSLRGMIEAVANPKLTH